MALITSNAARESKKNADSVPERLHLLYVTSKWSDCTFLVGNQENVQVFEAHKLILASSSPVFEAMCYGAMAEQYSIKVPDIEPTAFRIMLQYIYTDVVDLKTLDDACETLYAAKKYMLTNLVKKCRDYISYNVSATNVIAVLEFAEMMDETVLVEQCIQQISRYANHIFATQSEHMKPSTLSTILNLNDLNISEIKLIEGVMLWSEEECKKRSLEITIDNCRSVLDEAKALSSIRFLALTDEEFATGAPGLEILTKEERNMIWNCILLKKKLIESKDYADSPENSNRVFLNMINVPIGICNVTERRRHVPLKLFYCIRSFIKTSRVVSRSSEFVTKLAVSSKIFVNGVRFFSCLTPFIGVGDICQHVPVIEIPSVYSEVMQISIYNNQNTLISQTVFRKAVEYSTKVIAFLEVPIILFPDEVYSISFKSLNPHRMEHPTAFLSDSETVRGITFMFWDCSVRNNTTLAEGKDMGFLDSIIFSPV